MIIDFHTHIVTADRWDQMRRWAATLWLEVQRDGAVMPPGTYAVITVSETV